MISISISFYQVFTIVIVDYAPFLLSLECTLTVQEESTEVDGVTVRIMDTPCIDRLTDMEMNTHMLKVMNGIFKMFIVKLLR